MTPPGWAWTSHLHPEAGGGRGYTDTGAVDAGGSAGGAPRAGQM